MYIQYVLECPDTGLPLFVPLNDNLKLKIKTYVLVDCVTVSVFNPLSNACAMQATGQKKKGWQSCSIQTL